MKNLLKDAPLASLGLFLLCYFMVSKNSNDTIIDQEHKKTVASAKKCKPQSSKGYIQSKIIFPNYDNLSRMKQSHPRKTILL